MTGRFYKILVSASRFLGIWVVELFAWIISTGYFFFLHRRRNRSIEFYQVLFPEKSRLFHIRCAWNQFHHFAMTYADRLRIHQGKATNTASGFEHLKKMSDEGLGGILLMSHFGDWEVAARLLAGHGVKLLLYVGTKQREQIEKMMKEDMHQSGIRIATAPEGSDSPFTLVESVSFLREGGFLSISGDRVWSPGQRTLECNFKNRVVQLPAAPFALAMTTRAPLLPFFVTRKARGRFHMEMLPPLQVIAENRNDRENAMKRAAASYLELLETKLLKYPEHWYHFESWLAPEEQ